ncbi:hypothetical protein IPG41_00460 [Candidatus Peregrinibacteria bacterium]|nr:MAG: hypothetical protein IPG41_00460 [Candidatus Peregrinibacteria bacterium]
MLDVIIFNVELGQSIFFYPRNNPEYGMFVDCGHTQDFHPLDFLLEANLIHLNENVHTLGNLTLTNYDHDHFSGLPYLLEKTNIWTVRLPKNIHEDELEKIKPEKTEALEKVCHLKRTYTGSAENHVPPYKISTFSLEKKDFPGAEINTNHLSQVVFVEYGGSTICISGDLEVPAWEKILMDREVKEWLQKTDIYVAAHHGRENGYAEEIFEHCSPECIILSDKKIMHGTQEGMVQRYSNRVLGDGVAFNRGSSRKVLTTRSDGHIWIRFKEGGVREYASV